MSHGLYLITGRRRYRGHGLGEKVVMRLEPAAEYRAIARGDIQLLERIEPTVPEGYELPRGWLQPRTPSQSTEAPQGASFVGGGP